MQVHVHCKILVLVRPAFGRQATAVTHSLQAATRSWLDLEHVSAGCRLVMLTNNDTSLAQLQALVPQVFGVLKPQLVKVGSTSRPRVVPVVCVYSSCKKHLLHDRYPVLPVSLSHAMYLAVHA